MNPFSYSLPARVSECRGILVDSNTVLDIATSDPAWGEWSERALGEAAEYGDLIINPIIYAEVSVGFSSIEAVDAALPPDTYRRDPLPWEAAFLAGKCYYLYRRRGGVRTSPLPDFYIGAHAAVERLALLTRDPSVYGSYFPTLQLLTPSRPSA